MENWLNIVITIITAIGGTSIFTAIRAIINRKNEKKKEAIAIKGAEVEVAHDEVAVDKSRLDLNIDQYKFLKDQLIDVQNSLLEEQARRKALEGKMLKVLNERMTEKKEWADEMGYFAREKEVMMTEVKTLKKLYESTLLDKCVKPHCPDRTPPRVEDAEGKPIVVAKIKRKIE